MKRRALWSVALLGAVALVVFVSKSVSRPADLCRKELRIPSMGTIFEVQYVKSCGPDVVGQLIKQKLDRWEASMSLYQSESEISRLNKSGLLEDPSADFLRLINISLGHSVATEGYFDITVWPVLKNIQTSFKTRGVPPNSAELLRLRPLVDFRKIETSSGLHFAARGMMITLDGIAKGFAVDEIGAWLRENGVANFLVNFSGNMLASGVREDGKVWSVGIPDPQSGEMTALELNNSAVASSGVDYASYSKDKSWHHLIDPHTLRPAAGVVGTTVTGPSATTCDVLSTTLFVMGEAKAAQIIRKNYPLYKYWIFAAKPGKSGRIISEK